ncbi:inositol monophosphatase family protein, partial [uncultured Shimia sp.]|uniref:inositol monophosphatase family protein n=1 Tax=uncultured Shimia sp. TaxID=573152 RepID=UPI0025D37C01
MPVTDLDLLIAAAQRAGKIATRYNGPDAKAWHKPEGAGPVTEADLAVNEMLEDTLRAARPDYGWLSEESLDEGDRIHAEKTFIIDPIDGTRSFIEGSDTWAHALAIAE